MTIIKRIQQNYSTILRAKIYFFFKKSVWIYLIGIFMIAYVSPIQELGFVLSGLLYFIGFILILIIPLYHFGSKILAKRNEFDADIEFNEHNIIIKHRNKDLTETKKWSWVKKIEITDKAVFLVANEPHNFLISFNKSNLTAEELQFFGQRKINL